MKAYIQFLVEGTFGLPVERLGSDGVKVLDGRLSLNNMINEGIRSCGSKLYKPVGFKIVQAERFTSEGKILYSHTFKTY